MLAAKEFSVCRQRNVDVIVHRTAQKRAAFLLHTDNSHRRIIDLDRLSNGVLILKEFLSHRGPDDTNISRMVDFLGREKAAFAETLILNQGHSGRHAGDACEEHLAPIMLKIYWRVGLRAHLDTGSALISEPLVILDIELLVAPQHLLSLFFSHPPLMGKAVDHKMIGAQRFRDGGHHISIEAIDRRSD